MHARLTVAALAAALLACDGSSRSVPAPTPEPPVVWFTSPGAPVHTDREAVPLQVYVAQPSDRVELLRNGEPFAVLAPPYQYTFFTALEAEGRHAFVARARVGGAWKESAALDVFVDRTSPSIVERSPGAGVAWASPLDPITFAFDEPVDPGTLAGNVLLSSAARGAVPAQVSLDEDGCTVRVVPAGAFAADDRVWVTVGEVRDLAGHRGAASTWWFDVPGFWELLGGGAAGEHGWTAPSLAVEPGTGALLVDSSLGWLLRIGAGTQEVVAPTRWMHRMASDWRDVWGVTAGASGSALRLVRLEAGAWVQVGAELPVATTYPVEVALAVVGPDVLVGWTEVDFPPGANVPAVSTLHLRRWDGSAWRSVATIDRSGVRWVGRLRVASGPGGPAYVAFDDGGPRVARVVDDALVDLPAPEVSSLAIALSPMGVPFVVGVASGPPRAVRVYALEGGAWTAVGDLVTTTSPYVAWPEADLVVDAQGRVTVAWREGDGGALRAKRFEGGAWVERGGVLNVDPARAVRGGPRLALDAGGRPVVAWTEEIPATSSTPLGYPTFVKRLLP